MNNVNKPVGAFVKEQRKYIKRKFAFARWPELFLLGAVNLTYVGDLVRRIYILKVYIPFSFIYSISFKKHSPKEKYVINKSEKITLG